MPAPAGFTVSYVCNDGPGGATRLISQDSVLPDRAIPCGVGANFGTDMNIVGYAADDPSATFIQAGPGAKPNAGRNTVGTPGLNIWNMSLFKSTRLTERFSLQFRAETYNTFNHRNFSIGLPTNNGAIDQVTNPNPLSTAYIFVTSGNLFLNNSQFNGGSRTMQLGLRLVF